MASFQEKNHKSGDNNEAYLHEIRLKKDADAKIRETYLSARDSIDLKIEIINKDIEELETDLQICKDEGIDSTEIETDIKNKLKQKEKLKDNSNIKIILETLTENVSRHIISGINCGEEDISKFYKEVSEELGISELILSRKKKKEESKKEISSTSKVPYKEILTAKYAINAKKEKITLDGKTIFSIRVSRKCDPPEGVLFRPTESGKRGGKGGNAKGFKNMSRSIFGSNF